MPDKCPHCEGEDLVTRILALNHYIVCQGCQYVVPLPGSSDLDVAFT